MRRDLNSRLRTAFADRFATAGQGGPDAVESAPGRVNLLGEHTDYNDGFVLPTAIPQRTWVAVRREPGPREVTAASLELDAPAVRHRYRLGDEARGRGWIDYLQGVTAQLAQSGRRLPGLTVLVTSDVPVGSGLSSSAALLVAFLRTLRRALSPDLDGLDDVALARLAQRAEVELVGAPVGLLDQLACSLCDEESALFIDTRSLERQRLRLPVEAELVVIHSGVTHSHVTGDYRTRRRECEAAASALGVASLRELDETALPRLLRLPEPLGRRARHVITENARVLAARALLEAAAQGRSSGQEAAQELGRLFYASHDSQRDDYEVSVPAVDELVELGRGDADVLGARLTGGGFGGSVVYLVQAGRARACAERLADAYRASGHQPVVLVPPTAVAEAEPGP